MSGGAQTRERARRIGRAVVFVALGAILAGQDLTHTPALMIAAVMAAIAAAEIVASRRQWRWRALGAIRFAAHFARISIIGGVDVARRALSLRRAIDPGLTTIRLEAFEGETPAAALFVGAISLVPGTLCAEIEGRQITVHVIDRSQDHDRRLRTLEARVAGVFAGPAEEGA